MAKPYQGITNFDGLAFQKGLYVGADGAEELIINSSGNFVAAIDLSGNVVIGDSSSDTLIVHSTSTFNAVIKGANGAETVPQFTFTSDPDTGMYRAGTNTLGFSTGGTLRLSFDTSVMNIRLPIGSSDGTASAPGYSFENDLNTGLYRVAADTLGFTTGGTARLTISTTAIQPTLALGGADGSAGAPSYSFSADADVGMYRDGTNTLAFATNGVLRLAFDASVMNVRLPIGASDGTAADPGYRFENDLNLGIYRIGADNLGFSANGTAIGNYSSAGLWTLGASGGTQTHVINGSMQSTRFGAHSRSDVVGTTTIIALASTHGFVKLTGTATITIQGITAGSDGQILRIYNSTANNLTFAHQNGGAAAANQITTMTGADVATTGAGFGELIYDTGSSKWILMYATA